MGLHYSHVKESGIWLGDIQLDTSYSSFVVDHEIVRRQVLGSIIERLDPLLVSISDVYDI